MHAQQSSGARNREAALQPVLSRPHQLLHQLAVCAQFAGLLLSAHADHPVLKPAACRGHKQVVLSIRGTSSVADLVTDAVMHPEPIGDWLPAEFSKVWHPVG